MSWAQQILSRVVEIQRGIAGIRDARIYLPFDLPVSQMPCFLNTIEAQSIFYHAAGLYRLEYVIRMHLAVAPLTTDSRAEEIQRKAMDFEQPVLEAFAARLKLSRPADGVVDMPFVSEAFIRRWSLDVFQVGSGQAVGLIFELQVNAKPSVTVSA